MKYISIKDYIYNHLCHLQLDLKNLVFLKCVKNSRFWMLNVDSLFSSFFVICLLTFFLHIKCKKLSVYSPENFQIFIEIILVFINKQIYSSIKKNSIFISSISFLNFVWIFCMNSISLLPHDVVLYITSNLIGINNLHIIPTADINITLAMSLSVLIILIYYKIKNRGFGIFMKKLFFHPFNFFFMIPFNLILELIEHISKVISLGLRLFGNIYSCELILLITTSLAPICIQWLLIFLLSIFHMPIILLQSFIFMILTIVYISVSIED
ncbi:MAG: F0F1 ATP synthase subunit A [Enterobacteriaceae bacterium]